MKRHLPLIAAIIIAVSAAIVILVIVNRRLRREVTGIPPVALHDSTCVEPATTSDFPKFLQQFREAIKSKDKRKLFSMVHTCSFYWDVLNENEALRKPVLAPAYAPYQRPPYFIYTLVRGARTGSSLVFETDDDLLANYDVIFSDFITRHLLGDTPTAGMDGRFEIRWRRNDGLRTLSFDRIDNLGYKFTGLQWEP